MQEVETQNTASGEKKVSSSRWVGAYGSVASICLFFIPIVILGVTCYMLNIGKTAAKHSIHPPGWHGCGFRSVKPWSNDSKHSVPRLGYGQNATLYEYPWSVAIQLQDKDGRPFICSGSLLNQMFVLTAAHCCQPNATWTFIDRVTAIPKEGVSVQGLVGAINYATPEYPAKLVKFSRCYVHRSFKPLGTEDDPLAGFVHDIALMKMSERLPEPTYPYPYNSICLPDRDISSRTVELEVAGWGRDEGNISGPLRKGRYPYHQSLGRCRTLERYVPRRTLCVDLHDLEGYPRLCHVSITIELYQLIVSICYSKREGEH